MAAAKKEDDNLTTSERWVTYYNTFSIVDNVITYKLYSTFCAKEYTGTYYLSPAEIEGLKKSPARTYVPIIIETLMCHERELSSAHTLVVDIPNPSADLLAAFRTLSLNHNPKPPYPHPWYKNKDIRFAKEIAKKPRSG